MFRKNLRDGHAGKRTIEKSRWIPSLREKFSLRRVSTPVYTQWQWRSAKCVLARVSVILPIVICSSIRHIGTIRSRARARALKNNESPGGIRGGGRAGSVAGERCSARTSGARWWGAVSSRCVYAGGYQCKCARVYREGRRRGRRTRVGVRVRARIVACVRIASSRTRARVRTYP